MVSCREQWAVTAPCLKLPRFSFILNRGFKLLARGPLTAQVTPTCGPYLHIKSAILSEEQIWGCQQLCRDAVITRLSSETLFCCRSLVFLFAVGLRSSYSVFLCVFPVSCVSVAPPEHMHNRCVIAVTPLGIISVELLLAFVETPQKRDWGCFTCCASQQHHFLSHTVTCVPPSLPAIITYINRQIMPFLTSSHRSHAALFSSQLQSRINVSSRSGEIYV